MSMRTLFPVALPEMAIEVGPVLIEQDETDHTCAYITVGLSRRSLNNAELHLLYARLALFMTSLNYEAAGWPRPY